MPDPDCAEQTLKPNFSHAGGLPAVSVHLGLPSRPVQREGCLILRAQYLVRAAHARLSLVLQRPNDPGA
jgi:hypothetical protein